MSRQTPSLSFEVFLQTQKWVMTKLFLLLQDMQELAPTLSV